MAEKKIKKARPVEQSPFSRSPVTIIIPFHGQYDKVGRLLKSIWTGTRSNPYEICLVDDSSPNSDFIEKMIDQPQVVPFRTPERLGFGGALKFGFERTTQPWVCFLNSDCTIEDSGWLIEMGRSLMRLRGQGVQMVSARSNNPGSFVNSMLKAEKSDKRMIEDFILEDGHLPLYCALCHRDLFEHIGGFIKEYPYGWYEDEELAYRMSHYGFSQAICSKSWVRHEGAATIKALFKENPEAKEIMASNRDRCIADISLL